MTYAHLGRSGLLVSRIGLGTMNFGFTVDESNSFAVMDAAIDAGINFFDTADVYAHTPRKLIALTRSKTSAGSSAASLGGT
jgi:aryl-alcohol dehydrogenase-like predicted oxidoreductase